MACGEFTRTNYNTGKSSSKLQTVRDSPKRLATFAKMPHAGICSVVSVPLSLSFLAKITASTLFSPSYLHGQLAVGLFDFLARGAFVHAQCLVELGRVDVAAAAATTTAAAGSTVTAVKVLKGIASAKKHGACVRAVVVFVVGCWLPGGESGFLTVGRVTLQTQESWGGGAGGVLCLSLSRFSQQCAREGNWARARESGRDDAKRVAGVFRRPLVNEGNPALDP